MVTRCLPMVTAITRTSQIWLSLDSRFWGMQVDRQPYRRTKRHAHRNIPFPYRETAPLLWACGTWGPWTGSPLGHSVVAQTAQSLQETLWTASYQLAEGDRYWCTVSQHRDPLSLEKGQWPHALATYRQHGNTPSWSTPLKLQRAKWKFISKQLDTKQHRLYNKQSVLSFLRQLTTWHCSQLLLSASRAAIDRYLLAAGPTAANPPQRRAAGEWGDGRTDWRTLDSCIDPAPHTMPAVSTRQLWISETPNILTHQNNKHD